jgi:hypothetical protein
MDQKTLIASLLGALLSVTGLSGLVSMRPEVVRPDPATGSDLRAAEERLTNRIELHEQRVRHALESHVLREHVRLDLKNDDPF